MLTSPGAYAIFLSSKMGKGGVVMRKAVVGLMSTLMCLFLVLPIFAEEDISPFDDPYYGQQWSMEAIDWLPVWQQGLTGKGVKIGIIDSGAYADHEDLQGAYLQGKNLIGEEGETFADDQIGHGTFVAGIIAADPNNGKGIVGIAPDAEIYAYRAFSGNEGSVLTVLDALEQALADGCQIINLSMGTPANSQKLFAGIQKAQEAGVLVIAAVGNGNYGITTTLYPAGYEGVIGVGSVNQQLERSYFSQTNESVFVVAPGQALASLSHTNAKEYVSGSGTSYAAPIVTALAALALDYDPTLTPEEITEMLRLTATDLGEPGYDTSYGYGLVNAADLIAGFQGKFAIHYRLSAGELPSDTPLNYQTDTGLTQLPVPTRENYTFAGWYADEARTQPVTEIPADTRGQITFYDSWKAEVNRISDYRDGMVQCLVKEPAQVLLAAYDQDGCLIDLAWAAVAPNTERVPLSVREHAFQIKGFLCAKDGFYPLCEAWDSRTAE